MKVYGFPATGLPALVPIVVDYTSLGIEHILTGFDHLLFVVALTLLVERRRQLLATITAFTVGSTSAGSIRMQPRPIRSSSPLSQPATPRW